MSKKNVTAVVEAILEVAPETRDSDEALYVAYLQATGRSDMLSMRLGNFLLNRNNKKIPSIETVSRCRRKVQEQRPDLRATKETIKIRETQEREWKKYAEEPATWSL